MFRVLSLALVACLLMAGSAFADMKIGVFNSQAVAMDSDAAQGRPAEAAVAVRRREDAA